MMQYGPDFPPHKHAENIKVLALFALFHTCTQQAHR